MSAVSPDQFRDRARFRGVYTIPVTPFHEDGAIDYPSLRRCVEYCIECGAHGLVMPVNASEFFTLSDAERVAVIKTGVDVNAGAIPLVAGTSGVSPQHALELSLAAQEAGADAVMVLPPTSRGAPAAAMEEHFRTIGQAVDIPVFLQNHDPPAGQKIPLDVMVRLLRDVESIRYIKEETMPPGQAITAELEAAGEACEGVMGGMGGRYLLDEYRRGSCGTMPGCHVTDVHVALWNALERMRSDAMPESGAGTATEGAVATQVGEARRIYNMMAPLLLFEVAFGAGIYKHVLHRRGVISTPFMRAPARRHLDKLDLEELDRLLGGLSELMTWGK